MTYSPGLLARGMTVSDETLPSAPTMEALCLDAGLRKEEFRSIVDAVDSTLQQWPELAREDGVPEGTIREIGERLARNREVVLQA